MNSKRCQAFFCILSLVLVFSSGCGVLNHFSLPTCFFKPYGDGSPFNVYNGPTPIDLETLDYVDTGPYPVLAESEYRIQVIGDAGITGWTIRAGIFSGNCDNLPFVQTRPDLPGDGCYVYWFEPHEYSTSTEIEYDTTRWQTITLPAQQYVEVTRFAGAALSSIYAAELQLPEGGPVWAFNTRTGYGQFSEGVGKCDDVPIVDITG